MDHNRILMPRPRRFLLIKFRTGLVLRGINSPAGAEQRSFEVAERLLTLWHAWRRLKTGVGFLLKGLPLSEGGCGSHNGRVVPAPSETKHLSAAVTPHLGPRWSGRSSCHSVALILSFIPCPFFF